MPETVQLFVTCTIDTFYPEIGQAVLRVLRRAGVEVNFPPDQTCCGQPAFNAGLREQARQVAEHTIRTFEKVAGAVIIPSGSCAAMIRHSYPELFAGDNHWLPRAASLAERTYELSEYLVDVLGVTDLGASYPGNITYHSSCHLLRELGVNRQPRALLDAVRDLHFSELPQSEECCGFGGVHRSPDFSLSRPIAR